MFCNEKLNIANDCRISKKALKAMNHQRKVKDA